MNKDLAKRFVVTWAFASSSIGLAWLMLSMQFPQIMGFYGNYEPNIFFRTAEIVSTLFFSALAIDYSVCTIKLLFKGV